MRMNARLANRTKSYDCLQNFGIKRVCWGPQQTLFMLYCVGYEHAFPEVDEVVSVLPQCNEGKNRLYATRPIQHSVRHWLQTRRGCNDACLHVADGPLSFWYCCTLFSVQYAAAPEVGRVSPHLLASQTNRKDEEKGVPRHI